MLNKPNFKLFNSCLGDDIRNMTENHGNIISAAVKLKWWYRNFDVIRDSSETTKEYFYNGLAKIAEHLNNPTILEDINREEDELLLLPQGYSREDFDAFMKRANEYFYDSGFGLAEIDGVVYCEKGTCYIHEYDGSTTWNLIPLPPKTVEEARDVIM